MTTDDQLNIQGEREREKLISWAYKNTLDILERESEVGILSVVVVGRRFFSRFNEAEIGRS